MESIIELANKFAISLDIDEVSKRDLINMITTKFKDFEMEPLNQEIIGKIDQLLSSDKALLDFEKNKLSKYTHKTQANFKMLKNNLAKLQILILIKKIEKSTNMEELLNTIFNALNSKIVSINNILELKGGADIEKDIFYDKYIKYKIKYLNLLYKPLY